MSEAKKTTKRVGKVTSRKAQPKRQAAKPKPKPKPAAKERKDAGPRQKLADRFAKEGAELRALVEGGTELPAAAKKLGISLGKAQRLYARATLAPGDLVSGTDAEVAKAIVRLRDEEELAFVSDIWARVPGMSGTRIKKLYKEAKAKK
jgi:hypothetical protein